MDCWDSIPVGGNPSQLFSKKMSFLSVIYEIHWPIYLFIFCTVSILETCSKSWVVWFVFFVVLFCQKGSWRAVVQILYSRRRVADVIDYKSGTKTISNAQKALLRNGNFALTLWDRHLIVKNWVRGDQTNGKTGGLINENANKLALNRFGIKDDIKQ